MNIYDNPKFATAIPIAKICHQANKTYCEGVGDFSQKDWCDAEAWQRESAIEGVLNCLDNPDVTAEMQHQAWMDSKLKDGWVYGLAKDSVMKIHPHLVPYEKLPKLQRMKDELFIAIVKALNEK